MKVLIYFTILLFFLSACSNKNKSEGRNFRHKEGLTHYVIDIGRMRKLENFREAITDIEFIPLETNSKSLLAGIDKVIFYSDHFYVLDKKYSSLKVFDKNGKYIRTIGGIGHGPGEFSSLMDFNLDPESETLLLLSNNEQAVFRFTLKGEYIETIRNNLFASAFSKTNDKWYYFINQNDNHISKQNNLIVMNSSGVVLERLFPFSTTFNVGLSFGGVMFQNNEGVLYSSPLSDTIFQLTDNLEIYPKYVVDFGSKKLSPMARNSYENFAKESSTHSFLMKPFLESNGILTFTYQDENVVVSAFCDTRKIGESVGHSNVLVPIELSFPVYYFPVGVTEDGGFISYTTTQFLDWLKQGYLSEEDLKEDYPSLFKLVPSLTLTDNPILVKYKLKAPQSLSYE